MPLWLQASWLAPLFSWRPPPPPSPPPLDMQIAVEIAEAVHELENASVAWIRHTASTKGRAPPRTAHSSAQRLWGFMHEGAALCNATVQAAKLDLSAKMLHAPTCQPAHAMAPTVIFDGAGLGLTNQLMAASQALDEACRTRRNFAGYWHPTGYGGSASAAAQGRDLSELFELRVFHARLRRGSTALLSLYAGCANSSGGKLDVRPVNCRNTELVPLACLGQRNNRSSGSRQVWHHLPKRPQMLFAMEPNRRVPWLHTLCGFPLAAATFNAIHFNIDADWLLFICSSFATYTRYGTGLFRDGEEASLLSANGSHAPFVRRVVIPQFIRAMRLAFVDPTLPVVACTSLGKLFRVTMWIVDEFEQAVNAAFGVPLVLGSTGNDWRELNALADLRMLVHARSAVLWPGSTFSELAALHRAARNASVGWVADLRSNHLCAMTATHRGAGVVDAGGMLNVGLTGLLTGAQLVGATPKALRPITGRTAASPCLTFLR